MANIIPPGPWNVFPEQWDRVVLADYEWPGLATVTVSRANKWDSKKAKGSHGEEREFSGVDPAKVVITIKFWDFDAWYQIVVSDLIKTVEPDPGKTKVDSITIGHAVAAARGVTRITVDSVDGPTKVEEGIWSFTVNATEYRPPSTKNATGTASGSGGGSSAKPGDPKNAVSQCSQLANELSFNKSEFAEINRQIFEIEGSDPSGRGDELSALYDAQAENLQRRAEIEAQQIAFIRKGWAMLIKAIRTTKIEIDTAKTNQDNWIRASVQEVEVDA